MTKEEIFEEIRDRLAEALVDSVEDPWNYQDEDLERSIRSAMRHIRVSGVDTVATMDDDGELSEDPTENIGMLIAYRVASELLCGDLRKKLLDGEMGMTFRMGPDYIDTKTAANNLNASGKDLDDAFDRLLTIVLTSNYSDVSMFFGGPETSFEQ